MRRPTPSRLNDALLGVVVALALLALVPVEPLATVALAVMTTALIAWPLGVLVWLARRWARAGDWRFVGLATLLTVSAATSALIAIALGR